MYRFLQIQYSQIAKAALRFIIPWSSLNKVPKFIPGIRALLSLDWDAGHLFWESCETLTCTPLIWSNPMSRTSDSSWSQQSVQWDPLPSKHLYLHLSLYQLLAEPRGLVSVKNAVRLQDGDSLSVRKVEKLYASIQGQGFMNDFPQLLQ